jgi:hypothetical protein
VLTREVELVPAAAWIAQGERVMVSERRGPTVRATRAFGESGDAHRKPSPESLDRRLFCHDLELATSATPPAATSDASGGASAHLRSDVVVPLLAQPNGKEVARIAADVVRVVERQTGFVHVAGDAPFRFDGWVKATFLQGGESGDAP